MPLQKSQTNTLKVPEYFYALNNSHKTAGYDKFSLIEIVKTETYHPVFKYGGMLREKEIVYYGLYINKRTKAKKTFKLKTQKTQKTHQDIEKYDLVPEFNTGSRKYFYSLPELFRYISEIDDFESYRKYNKQFKYEYENIEKKYPEYFIWKIEMKRIRNFEDIKVGNYYLIESLISENSISTISKCVKNNDKIKKFNDEFLIDEGGDNIIVTGWELNAKFGIGNDPRPDLLAVYEINPEDYPEYFAYT